MAGTIKEGTDMAMVMINITNKILTTPMNERA